MILKQQWIILTKMKKQIKWVLKEKQILFKIKEISKKIKQAYKDEPLLLLIVLKGGLNYGVHLFENLSQNVYIEFIRSSSYVNNKKISKPKLVFIDNASNFDFYKNKHVLIVEDIIDTGETVIEISKKLKNTKYKSLAVTALFGSESRKKSNLKEYFVFDKKPEGFLVGFGLDDNELLRNIPNIGIIKNNK